MHNMMHTTSPAAGPRLCAPLHSPPLHVCPTCMPTHLHHVQIFPQLTLGGRPHAKGGVVTRGVAFDGPWISQIEAPLGASAGLTRTSAAPQVGGWQGEPGGGDMCSIRREGWQRRARQRALPHLSTPDTRVRLCCDGRLQPLSRLRHPRSTAAMEACGSELHHGPTWCQRQPCRARAG